MTIDKALLSRIQNNDPELTFILLSNQKLDNDDIRNLADAFVGNTFVKEIDLSHNKNDYIGAQYLAELLAKNTTVITVDLGHNNIGNVGIKHLTTGLAENTELQSLYLNKNNITQLGAQYIANLLLKNKSLQTIDLNENKISEFGIEQLVQALEKNTSLLNLTGINDKNNCISKYLARNQNLAQEFSNRMQNLLDDLIKLESEDSLSKQLSIQEEKITLEIKPEDNLDILSCITEEKIKNTEMETTANTPFCFFLATTDAVSNDQQNKLDTITPSDGMKSLQG